MQTGLERLIDSGFAALTGKRIGVVCNQATVSERAVHILDVLLPGHHAGQYSITAAFGPQHGIWGHTQDNMIEWEGYVDPATGLRFYSLYGEHREPTALMLADIDLLVIDLPDIGSRYYTFIWTMALCLKACEPLGIPVLILDRPNPLGRRVEGTMLEAGLESFVGLYPIPTRHGLTLGEAALYLRATQFPNVDVSVLECHGQGQPIWVMPSPNMPTRDTALVYPGMCLLEGTMLSEGRGTTRPFEMSGAPYIDGRQIAGALNALGLPGAYFRPIVFQPTFHKFAEQVCQGAFIHVTDPETFEPVLTGIAILQEVIRAYESDFAWRPAPYEYVWDREPIDILAGAMWVRPAIESLTPIQEIRERMASETADFHTRPEVRLLSGA